MATHPDSESEKPRGAGRSWSALVAAARKAQAPRVDTAAAVWATIAEEDRAARVGAEADDGWTEFARIFAAPRLVASGAAGICAAGPLALWVVTSGLSRLDVFAKFLVYGGLPGWLVAMVT
jgi:uncharacterized protein (DUF2345 family)